MSYDGPKSAVGQSIRDLQLWRICQIRLNLANSGPEKEGRRRDLAGFCYGAILYVRHLGKSRSARCRGDVQTKVSLENQLLSVVFGPLRFDGVTICGPAAYNLLDS